MERKKEVEGSRIRMRERKRQGNERDFLVESLLRHVVPSAQSGVELLLAGLYFTGTAGIRGVEL